MKFVRTVVGDVAYRGTRAASVLCFCQIFGCLCSLFIRAALCCGGTLTVRPTQTLGLSHMLSGMGYLVTVDYQCSTT